MRHRRITTGASRAEALRAMANPTDGLAKGHSRRGTELLLLLLAAVPVLLLHALFVLNASGNVSLANLAVPLGLLAAFGGAHIALRFLAPGADPVIMPIVLALSGTGITFLMRLAPDLAVSQIVWLFVSVGAMVGTLFMVRNLDSLADLKYTTGVIGIALLILPMLIGTERGGARLWVFLGPFGFQPGEFAKILVVLFLAFYLASNREALSASMRRIGPIALPRLGMLLPVFIMWGLAMLVVVFEKDLGSALLLFVFFVVMLYVSTGRVSYVMVSLLLAAAGAVLCYKLFGHVRTRVDIWLNPWADPAGGGYQILQSLYSLADGGLVGTGIGKGLANLVPVVESDFIFTAIGEEMGLLGGSAILLLYLVLAVRGMATAARARSDSSAFAAAGLTTGLCFQAFLIVAGVTKLLPLTGVTLPFMSQGGTSLLASFIALGLLLRAGDEGTGHEVELANQAGTDSSQRDPLSGWGSHMSDMAQRVVRGRHAQGHFGLQTAESGVLGRVALGKRLTSLVALFSILFATLIANLTFVQQVDAARIRNLSTNGHTLAHSAYVQRGAIISADGQTLAESVQNADGTFTRRYPSNLARHTVGYISTQFGSSGIEASMNEALTGREDYSSWNRALYTVAGIKRPGSTVALTINSLIQQAAEEALEGRTGAIVVLDPKTGAVLAKASSPSYNVDDLDKVLTEGSGGQLLDRTSQVLYAPGSTFKAITLSAALDTGFKHLNDQVYAGPRIDLGGGEVKNYDGNDYGSPDVAEAFALSSNTAFARMAADMGARTLVQYANAFGYGRTIGQDFQVATSIMSDPSLMSEWETGWAGCGQPVGQHTGPLGPQVTVMQNAVVAQAIANGGIAMDPYVVDHVLSSEGAVIATTTPRQLGRALSVDAASQVKEAMLGVVDHGTGRRAKVEGSRVAGKTGTAQMGGDNINSLFIGFAPYDNPTLVISICVEGQGENVEGVAAALAGRVLATALSVQSAGAGT